jgi:hypothetical protein
MRLRHPQIIAYTILILAYTLFVFSYATALWQYFEFAYKLTEAGLIAHPVWSGTWGPPYIHHGYLGFIGVALGFALIMRMRRGDRGKTSQTHR